MAAASLLAGYLIVGTDEVKRDATVERLKGRLASSGMLDFNFDERDMRKDQEVDDVLSSLNTYPMGTDFRLVVLTGCDRMPKQLSEALAKKRRLPPFQIVAYHVAGTVNEMPQRARQTPVAQSPHIQSLQHGVLEREARHACRLAAARTEIARKLITAVKAHTPLCRQRLHGYSPALPRTDTRSQTAHRL